MTGADSAGRPWAGRAFEAGSGAWSNDDGTAPAGFLAALAAFRAGEAGPEAVVDVLRSERLLVPLLAEERAPGSDDVADPAGPRSHRAAELALVTVAGPDGRPVLPAFSSAAAMRSWNPAARPVPAAARQVALGAAADGTELVIIDPGSETRFGLRRGALEALARDLPWRPAPADPDVHAAIRSSVADEPAVAVARVAADDPACTLDGAEVRVTLVLRQRLERVALDALLTRLQSRWREDPMIVARVDSLAVRIEAPSG